MEFTSHNIVVNGKQYVIEVRNYTDTLTINQLINDYRTAIEESNEVFPNYNLLFSTCLIRYLTTFEEVYSHFTPNTNQYALFLEQLRVIDSILGLIPQAVVEDVHCGLVEYGMNLQANEFIDSLHNDFYRNHNSKKIEINVKGNTYIVEVDTKVDKDIANIILNKFKFEIESIMKERGRVEQSEFELIYGTLMIRFFTNFEDVYFDTEDNYEDYINLDDNLQYANYLISLGIYMDIFNAFDSSFLIELGKLNKKKMGKILLNVNSRQEQTPIQKTVNEVIHIDDRPCVRNDYNNLDYDSLLDLYNMYKILHINFRDEEYKNKMNEIMKQCHLKVDKSKLNN